MVDVARREVFDQLKVGEIAVVRRQEWLVELMSHVHCTGPLKVVGVVMSVMAVLQIGEVVDARTTIGGITVRGLLFRDWTDSYAKDRQILMSVLVRRRRLTLFEYVSSRQGNFHLHSE
jgi:hypothetical protein